MLEALLERVEVALRSRFLVHRGLQRLPELVELPADGAEPLARPLDFPEGANQVLLRAHVRNLVFHGACASSVERRAELGHAGAEGAARFGCLMYPVVEPIHLLRELTYLALLFDHRGRDVIARAAAHQTAVVDD